MKKILIIALFALFITNVNAQNENYNNAIGLRGGLGNGITFKHFLTDQMAAEAILLNRWQGFEVVGLLEHHNEFLGQDGLKWFYGYGAHLGFYKDTVGEYSSGTGMTLGVDGIIGVEFVIPNAPISISVDWKPFFNLIGYSGIYPDGGAISIRYVF